jgi:hypothetical protein
MMPVRRPKQSGLDQGVWQHDIQLDWDLLGVQGRAELPAVFLEAGQSEQAYAERPDKADGAASRSSQQAGVGMPLFEQVAESVEQIMGVKAVWGRSSEPVMCFGSRGDEKTKDRAHFMQARNTAFASRMTRPSATLHCWEQAVSAHIRAAGEGLDMRERPDLVWRIWILDDNDLGEILEPGQVLIEVHRMIKSHLLLSRSPTVIPQKSCVWMRENIIGK